MSRNSPSWETMCNDQKNGWETNQQTLVKLRWFLFLYILSQQLKAVRSCWKQQHPHSESVKSHKISEKHLSEYKKVKAHTSQRLKRPELIPVSLTWRTPRGIAGGGGGGGGGGGAPTPCTLPLDPPLTRGYWKRVGFSETVTQWGLRRFVLTQENKKVSTF